MMRVRTLPHAGKESRAVVGDVVDISEELHLVLLLMVDAITLKYINMMFI